MNEHNNPDAIDESSLIAVDNPLLATTNPPAHEHLSPLQLRAVYLLVTGTPHSKIARELDIDRSTVSRWLKTDPHFLAEYNKIVNEIRSSSITRLENLLYDSIGVLENEVSKGSLKAALAVINLLSNNKLQQKNLPTEEANVFRGQVESVARETVYRDPFTDEICDERFIQAMQGADARDAYWRGISELGLDADRRVGEIMFGKN
ncbi:MAG: helix-turn-helix domain-containing protein [Negativicutes bacterium]|jgi:hypothetical protein